MCRVRYIRYLNVATIRLPIQPVEMDNSNYGENQIRIYGHTTLDFAKAFLLFVITALAEIVG